jgi:hypothetical protein
MRTVRPRAWRTWWWSGVGDRSRCDAGQERTRFGRVRERRGKAGASAGPATEGGGAMQSDDVQGGDAATELVYRKVACGAGGAAARRFGADPPRGQ